MSEGSGVFMKKLLLGMMILGSFSSYAELVKSEGLLRYVNLETGQISVITDKENTVVAGSDIEIISAHLFKRIGTNQTFFVNPKTLEADVVKVGDYPASID
jgi:hypothetical protein